MNEHYKNDWYYNIQKIFVKNIKPIDVILYKKGMIHLNDNHETAPHKPKESKL